MTIIAYRDGVIAADSMISEGAVGVGDMRKIARSPNGILVGGCGKAEAIGLFLAWAVKGFTKKSRPLIESDNSFSAMAVMPDGAVFFYDSSSAPYELFAPFHAMGSGQPVAIGAMAAGATAQQATEIAIKYVHGCGGDIQILTLKGKKSK